MRPGSLLQITALMVWLPAQAQDDHEYRMASLYHDLRRTYTQPVLQDGERFELVDARYEPCRRKVACYMRVLTPIVSGYLVRVLTPHGQVHMTGFCLDGSGRVPHGPFRYYDDAGTLRAEGRFSNGRKSGIWHRYDDRGVALSDKEYDGLEW